LERDPVTVTGANEIASIPVIGELVIVEGRLQKNV
jgi:hypothetical protein